MDSAQPLTSSPPQDLEARSYKLLAYHLAEKIPIRQVVNAFLDRLIDNTTGDANFRLGPESYFCVFSFGSVAFFNVGEAQQRSIIDRLKEFITPLPGDMISDDFLVTVSDGLREGVQFERAILSDLSPAKIQILALVLAQSATLEYYETVVEDLLDGAEAITEPMKSGRLPGYTRSTIRYIGLSLSTRRDLISGLYIVDDPEITWQDPFLDRLFKQMKSTMEIDVRYRGLEYKLKLIQEGVEVIVDLTNAHRNIMLEVAIVLLIVVEIVLAIMVLPK